MQVLEGYSNCVDLLIDTVRFGVVVFIASGYNWPGTGQYV